jgi:hypothetical protein
MLEMWSIQAIGKGPIYHLRPREYAAILSANVITQRVEYAIHLHVNSTASAHRWHLCGVPSIRTLYHSLFGSTGPLSIEWTEDNSYMCPDYSVVEPDKRESTWIWSTGT